MRKLIYSIAATVLAAAAVFVWSRTTLVPLQASTASSINLNRAAATAAISPTDMMRKSSVPFPAEQWEPF